MPQDNDEIYAGTSLQPLLDAQAMMMLPLLQRCAGDHALMLGARPHDKPPPLPLLGCWTQLYLQGQQLRGDLQAAADEPLPFVDGAFDLVLMSHALDIAPAANELLDESLRTLAPDGTLVVTGVHPVSTWAAWLRWRMRKKAMTLQIPASISHRLRCAGLEIQTARRVGSNWPGRSVMKNDPGGWIGGGYVVIARKRSRQMAPMRHQTMPLHVPASESLSPGARRHSARWQH